MTTILILHYYNFSTDLYVYGQTFETRVGNNTHSFSYFSDIFMTIGEHHLLFSREGELRSVHEIYLVTSLSVISASI